jgi:hypothetical protein
MARAYYSESVSEHWASGVHYSSRHNSCNLIQYQGAKVLLEYPSAWPSIDTSSEVTT